MKMTHHEDFFETEPEPQVHADLVEYTELRHQLAMQMLKKVRDSISQVIQLLETGDTTRATKQLVEIVADARSAQATYESVTGSKTIEGVFQGLYMIGEDGVHYEVPHNYASKSRLLEGDVLKLTIAADGSHLFKQIGPVDRHRLVGKLKLDASTNEPVVHAEDRVYKVLAASVSYHKGVPGDEVVILIPRGGAHEWAALERIVNK